MNKLPLMELKRILLKTYSKIGLIRWVTVKGYFPIKKYFWKNIDSFFFLENHLKVVWIFSEWVTKWVINHSGIIMPLFQTSITVLIMKFVNQGVQESFIKCAELQVCRFYSFWGSKEARNDWCFKYTCSSARWLRFLFAIIVAFCPETDCNFFIK